MDYGTITGVYLPESESNSVTTLEDCPTMCNLIKPCCDVKISE